MKRLCLLVLMSGFATAFLQGQYRRAPKSQPPDYYKHFQEVSEGDGITRAVMRNGMKVLIEEAPIVPLSSVTLLVQTGHSGAEPPRAAVEAIVEALTRHLSRAVHLQGAELVVRIEPAFTTISILCPDQNLRRILGLLPSLFAEPPTPEPRDLSRILAHSGERKKGATDGTNGSPSSDSDSSDDAAAVFRGVHRDYFHPLGTVLAVSGSVRHETALREVAEAFSPLRSPESARRVDLSALRSRDAELRREMEYNQIRGEVNSPAIAFRYAVPGPDHADFVAIEIVSRILANGPGALLIHPRLSDVVLDADAQLVLEGESAELEIRVTPKPDQIDSAEALVASAIQELASQPLDALLARGKFSLLLNHFRGLEDLAQRSRDLAVFEGAGGYALRERRKNRILSVSSSELRRVIERYFGMERLRVVEMLPADFEARTFTPETFRETMDILRPIEAEKVREAFLSWSDIEADVAIPSWEMSYVAPRPVRTSILRGPEFYLKQRHVAPLVRVGVFFPGGRLDEPEGERGATELMLRALMRSLPGIQGGIPLLALESGGVEFEKINEPDFFGFLMTMPSPRLITVLREMNAWLRDGSVTEEELEWARRGLISEIEGRRADSSGAPAELFGDHAYGGTALGEAHAVEALTHEEVVAWIKDRIQDVHPYILVSGDVSGTAFLQDLTRELSDARREVRRLQRRRNPVSADAELPVLEQRGPRVELHFEASQTHGRDKAALDVLARLWGAPGGSLVEALELKEFLARQVEVENHGLFYGGSFAISFEPAEGRLEDARKIILETVRQWGRQSLPQEEFLTGLVGALARHHALELRGREFLIEWMGWILGGSGMEFFELYPERVQQMSPGDIESAARRLLR
ncbi:MAG TPA: insulinase family protein [Acidobacteriota bacterium]|nr:insulinase family protein [Acidobacteriota bacterium]